VDYTADIDREEGAIVVPLSSLFNHETDEDRDSGSSNNTETALIQKETEKEEPEAALTYHPLLPDALYSLLLTHTISLTPPQLPFSMSPSSTPLREKEKAELNRWAREVARLQTICDGYPLFLPARSPYPPHSFPVDNSARADWIELLHLSGQTLLSVPGWETIVSALPRPSIQRKPTVPSLRDLTLSSKGEGSNNGIGVPIGHSKSDYPITTERAGIVSKFVEQVVFGNGVPWDLSTVGEETKSKKKKGKKPTELLA
jgi:hypothetical protein